MADERRDTVIILHNRRAGWRGRAKLIGRLEDALARHRFRVECTTDRGQFADVVAEATELGALRAVVVAGGDGTAADAVNRSPPGTRVALFPLGTENLLARYLGQKRDPAALAELVSGGIPVQLDACRADGRLFLLMIGVGFDAEVVKRLAENRKGHITRASYIKPLLAVIRRYQYPELRVYCDEESGAATRPAEPVTARWVFGVNLPVYSLGLQFAPGAVATDGRLDVCTFDRGSFLHGVKYFVHLLGRRHLRLRDAQLYACRRMRIEAADDAPVAYQLDGDPGGMLPVEVTIEPGRFTAIVSPDRARSLANPEGA